MNVFRLWHRRFCNILDMHALENRPKRSIDCIRAEPDLSISDCPSSPIRLKSRSLLVHRHWWTSQQPCTLRHFDFVRDTSNWCAGAMAAVQQCRQQRSGRSAHTQCPRVSAPPLTPCGLGPQAGARMNPCHSWRASNAKTWANKPRQKYTRLRKREVDRRRRGEGGGRICGYRQPCAAEAAWLLYRWVGWSLRSCHRRGRRCALI